MIDDQERRRIEAERDDRADTKNRLLILEKTVENITRMVAWGVKAVWGGIAYLAFRLLDFILNGGTLK